MGLIALRFVAWVLLKDDSNTFPDVALINGSMWVTWAWTPTYWVISSDRINFLVSYITIDWTDKVNKNKFLWGQI